jgi:transposase
VLEEMQVRLENTPDAVRIRRCTVEHPYGTIKGWMGATHFLTKGLDHVKTEMSLHVLAYNFKRLIAILSIADMMKAIKAFIRLHCLKTAMKAISEAAVMRSL